MEIFHKKFRVNWQIGLAAVLFWGPSLRAADPPAPKRPPNILLIFVDDLGYAELGCQGARDIRTPRIDEIARDGIRFTSGYVSAPVCCPSRAGLMTGRYQQRFGHELNAIGQENRLPHVGLPLTESTIADRLKTAGYATGLVGKWHLGGSARYHPRRRGFDEFFGFLHEGHFYVDENHPQVVAHLRPNEPPYDEMNPILRGTRAVDNPGYLTETLTNEALDFIDRHHDHPFFLYLSYNAIHSPMQVTETYLKRFPEIKDRHRQIFAAMLSALDDGVGAVRDKLREHGLDDNTLIFFISDNGGPTEELTSSNAPLRGGKGDLYEGGIRVPFLMAWKDHLPAGVVDDRPVISLDVLPTSLAAAGIKPTDQDRTDGVNLLPYLSGNASGPPHEHLFWRYGGRAAMREGNWKLVRPGGQRPWELYDLSTDLGETTDLSDQKPELAARLKREYKTWDAQLIEPLWGRGPR